MLMASECHTSELFHIYGFVSEELSLAERVALYVSLKLVGKHIHIHMYISSMYDIFPSPQNQPNVGKYAIHGWYGYVH